MNTDRKVEDLRRLLDRARADCDHLRKEGPEEAFLQAYVAVKSIELRLIETLRQPAR